jgi:peptidoglycan-associated lipoprotein
MFDLRISVILVSMVVNLDGCAGSAEHATYGESTPMRVVPGDCDLCSSIDDKVFFDSESADLTGNAQGTLAKQAEWLIRYPKAKITVAGNCDDRGTREYNIALGFRRAMAVRDFLVGKGVAPNRFSIVSYGKERPVATGSNDKARAKNRNVMTYAQ